MPVLANRAGGAPVQRPLTCGAQRSAPSRPLTAWSRRTRRDTDPGPGLAPGTPFSREPVEELEYDWPDLPPIDQMKTAITRRRVSQGMTYVLPIDKTKSSVENVYRTNLRVMFQTPYLYDVGNFNEERLRASVLHHMQTNTVPAIYKGQPGTCYSSYKLNAESEKVRRAYAHSAPPGGLTGKSVTPDSKELRPRSNLYLPMKTRMPEEAMKIKKEAEKILKSVQEDEDMYDPDRGEELRNVGGERTDDATKKNQSDLAGNPAHQGVSQGPVPFFKKTSQYKDYDELKNTQVPAKPPFPETLKSPFLSDDKNLQIWDWMTRGDLITDFSHFMSICS